MAKITKEKIKGCVKGSALTIATLCGVIGGIILGISLKEMKGKIFHENISFKLPYSFIFLLPWTISNLSNYYEFDNLLSIQ